MSAQSPSTAMTRTLIAVMTASAILVPVAARAALTNHDAQRIDLRVSGWLKHDHAFGPAACLKQLGGASAN